MITNKPELPSAEALGIYREKDLESMVFISYKYYTKKGRLYLAFKHKLFCIGLQLWDAFTDLTDK